MAKNEKKISNKSLKPDKPRKAIASPVQKYIARGDSKAAIYREKAIKLKKPPRRVIREIGKIANESKLMRSQKGRNEVYRKLRRSYSAYKSRVKRESGIILPEMPDLVKDPHKADIQEMKRFINLVREVQFDKEAREYKAVANRIMDYVYEGLSRVGEFAEYKAARVYDLVWAEIEKAEGTGDYTIIKMWKNKLPDIDRVVQQFIFDSKESDQEGEGHSTACWNALCHAILGTSYTEYMKLYKFYIKEDDVWSE